MINKRPYKDINKKEVVHIKLFIVMILILTFIAFCVSGRNEKIPTIIKPDDKEKIIQKLDYRKLSRKTTVEISDRTNNRYRFEWIDGKWYPL